MALAVAFLLAALVTAPLAAAKRGSRSSSKRGTAEGEAVVAVPAEDGLEALLARAAALQASKPWEAVRLLESAVGAEPGGSGKGGGGGRKRASEAAAAAVVGPDGGVAAIGAARHDPRADAVAAAASMVATMPACVQDMRAVDAALARAPTTVADVRLLEALAHAYAVVKLHACTVRAREAVAEWQTRHKGGTGARLLAAVGVVDALVTAGEFRDASARLERTQRALARTAPSSPAWPALWRVAADLDDCKGFSGDALASFLYSFLPPGAGAGASEDVRVPTPLEVLATDVDVKLALDYVQMLWRAADALTSGGNHTAAATDANAGGKATRYRPAALPRAIAAAVVNQTWLEAEVARMAGELLRLGPWRLPTQLPRRYLPGLAARPWHDVATQWPHLAPVVDLLEAAAPQLAAEYGELAAGGAMLRATECIHDARGAGGWEYYTVNGHWLPDRDDDGCSAHTPVACGLLRAVAAAGGGAVTILRGGYSAVGPGARLRAHCGVSNGQLKMHVGLVVPRAADGTPCATLTVAGEARPWEEGRVLFFDDSFVHSVANACDAPRVVFQLVLRHPDAAPDAVLPDAGSAHHMNGAAGVAAAAAAAAKARAAIGSCASPAH